MIRKEFLDKASNKHGIIYDYSLIPDTVRAHDVVSIICPDHGAFHQRAAHHYNGLGCRKCSDSNRAKSTEQFITESKLIHGDVYDYTFSQYVNNATRVLIRCPKHGYFRQEAWSHLNGCGCKKCTRNGRYTESYFSVNKDKKYANGELYLTQFQNNTELFYKIGITTKGYRSRWKKMKEYTNILVHKWNGDLYTLFKIEQQMLMILPTYAPKTKAFSGDTECFLCDPIELESIVAKISSHIFWQDRFAVDL